MGQKGGGEGATLFGPIWSKYGKSITIWSFLCTACTFVWRHDVHMKLKLKMQDEDEEEEKGEEEEEDEEEIIAFSGTIVTASKESIAHMQPPWP